MKTEILHIRIDEQLSKELKKLAEANGLSISSQVRMLIKKASEKRGQELIFLSLPPRE